MVETTINLWAVLVAAIAAMIIGSLWYSPMMFAKEWLAALGKSETDAKASATGPTYLVATISSLVTAYVMAHFIDYAGATNAWSGALTGFWIWLGFVFAMMVTGSLFEGRSMKLLFINATNALVTLMVIGAILAAWA